LIASQLLVEVELVKVVLARLEGKSDALAMSATKLLQMRHDLPAVWPHVEEHLYESAIALNAPAIAEMVGLVALEDRLSHLTGTRCARLIRDKVQSKKVIHEELVSRCRERPTKGVNDCAPNGGAGGERT
jgi:hypothetical protein